MTDKNYIYVCGGGGQLGIDFTRKLCERLQEKGIIKNSVVVINDVHVNADRGILGNSSDSRMEELKKSFEETLKIYDAQEKLLKKSTSYHEHKREHQFINNSRRMKSKK